MNQPLTAEEQSEVRVMREALKPLRDDKAKDDYIKGVTGAIAFVASMAKREDIADKMREMLKIAVEYWEDKEFAGRAMACISGYYDVATKPRTIRISSARHADPIILKVGRDLPDGEIQRLAGEEIAKKWGATVSSWGPWE